jgi:hypothetical protein
MANYARNENDTPPLPPDGVAAPGFEVMKAVTELSNNLIAAINRTPPPVVTRQDAPVVSSNGTPITRTTLIGTRHGTMQEMATLRHALLLAGTRSHPDD